MTTSTSTPRFSMDAVRAAAWQDEALAQELLAIFLRTAPAMLQRFAAALAAGDTRVLVTECHDLKNCLALLGATHASRACQQVESAAREQGRCPPAAVGARLCAEIEGFIGEVRRYRAGLAATPRPPGPQAGFTPPP